MKLRLEGPGTEHCGEAFYLGSKSVAFKHSAPNMLQIRAVSGDGLIAIDVASFVETLPAEMHPVQALKEQLHSMCGLPRFRQRLICLDDEDVNLDEESTSRPGEAQAVLLNFCP